MIDQDKSQSISFDYDAHPNRGMPDSAHPSQVLIHQNLSTQKFDRSSVLVTPEGSQKKLLVYDSSNSKVNNCNPNSVAHQSDEIELKVTDQKSAIEIKDFDKQIMVSSMPNEKQGGNTKSSFPDKIKENLVNIKNKSAKLIGMEIRGTHDQLLKPENMQNAASSTPTMAVSPITSTNASSNLKIVTKQPSDKNGSQSSMGGQEGHVKLDRNQILKHQQKISKSNYLIEQANHYSKQNNFKNDSLAVGLNDNNNNSVTESMISVQNNIDNKQKQILKKEYQRKMKKQRTKMLKKVEEESNRLEMIKQNELAIKKSIKNQSRMNTFNEKRLSNIEQSKRTTSSASLIDMLESYTDQNQNILTRNTVIFKGKVKKISPDTFKHQMGQSNISSDINLTNLANAYKSQGKNNPLPQQKEKRVLVNLTNIDQDINNQSKQYVDKQAMFDSLHKKQDQSSLQIVNENKTQLTNMIHSPRNKKSNSSQSQSNTPQKQKQNNSHSQRSSQISLNVKKSKVKVKNRPSIEIQQLDSVDKSYQPAYNVYYNSNNKKTDQNANNDNDKANLLKSPKESSGESIEINEGSKSSSDSSQQSDSDDDDDYYDEEDQSSSDQSQEEQQEREDMNRQVALLERALSYKKKDAHAKIDINKLLQSNKFRNSETSSISVTGSDDSHHKHKSHSNHHSHKEFKEQTVDKDEIILGLRAPTQVCKADRKYCLIYPNDKYKSIYWDTIVSIILLITCFLTPLNLAFTEELDQIGWFIILNYSIDSLFLIDIVINFMTAYQSDNHEVVDDRCKIIKNYFTGWFIIDFLAIFPTEILVDTFGSNNQQATQSEQADFNEMVRITRVSKLYKLVRITRLLRLVKLFKKDNKVVKSFGSTLQVSRAFERLSMFLLALILMCHFVGCMWIFVGRTVPDPDTGSQGWIEAGDYTAMTSTQLYLTSFYFAMTTLTTVGYGDISGNNSTERLICIFLHLIGVISYSIAAGSLTSILQNYDEMNQSAQEQVHILNRIYKENNLPNDIYYTLLNQIQNQSMHSSQDEIKEFLDDLPFRLKLRTILYIYKDLYSNIPFLNKQIDNFIAWIFPLLNHMFIPMDQYIYYETDQIVEIYFQTSGYSAFVLPFKQNIVYIDIMNGDHFGEIDFCISAKEQKMGIVEMMDNLNVKKFNMVRQFTIQAIRDSNYLTMNITNIQRMHKQFNSQFKELFQNADRTLYRALQQKAKAIGKIDDRHQVLQLVDYARQNEYVRNQVLSQIEKEKLNKEIMNKKLKKMHECNHAEQQQQNGVQNQVLDIMKEVNAMFFKRTVNLKVIRENSILSERESSSNIETDSSMEEVDISGSQASQNSRKRNVESFKLNKKFDKLKDDNLNQKFVQRIKNNDDSPKIDSFGMFVGSDKFRTDLYDVHFNKDKQKKMILSSVEKTLKKTMAEQTQQQLKQLQVENVSSKIRDQLGKFNKDIFRNHKVKQQQVEINQKLANKFLLTGKQKNIQNQLGSKIADNFKNLKQRRKSQRVNSKKLITASSMNVAQHVDNVHIKEGTNIKRNNTMKEDAKQ